MHTPFDPLNQHTNTDSKIIASLERISQAFRVLLWRETKEEGLSPIQLQILIFLHSHPPSYCNITYLAKEFNMTKATISDSVKVMEQKKLLFRQGEERDARKQFFYLHEAGKQIAQKASLFTQALQAPLASLLPQQKEVLLESLFQIIDQLNQSEVLFTQRMCFSCRFYSLNGNTSYCGLMERNLKPSELQIDCPEHIAK